MFPNTTMADLDDYVREAFLQFEEADDVLVAARERMTRAGGEVEVWERQVQFTRTSLNIARVMNGEPAYVNHLESRLADEVARLDAARQRVVELDSEVRRAGMVAENAATTARLAEEYQHEMTAGH